MPKLVTVTESETVTESDIVTEYKTVPESGTKTVPESGRGKKLKETKNKLKEITLQEFFNECRENKELPIPEDDPIFDYAKKVGIPLEFLKLGWIQFKSLQKPEKKQVS